MRSLLRAAIVALAIPLGGCPGGAPALNPITVLTGSIEQPITRNQVAALVQTEITVLIPVRYYVVRLRTCQPTETWLSTNGQCGEASVKAKMRAAVAEVRKWRRELTAFVRDNNQVDARVAFNEYNRVLDILRSVPKAGG